MQENGHGMSKIESMVYDHGRNMKTLKFDDKVATKIIQLIQFGILTGSDVSEEFMGIEMILKDGKLTLDPLYETLSDDRMNQKMAEIASSAPAQEEALFNPFKPFTMET